MAELKPIEETLAPAASRTSEDVARERLGRIFSRG